MINLQSSRDTAQVGRGNDREITSVIGRFPYRMALAGGWIDQPFLSRHNPTPPGAMVVVSLEPDFPYMDRCGMATSTRNVAMKLWNGVLPDRDPAELVRELYRAENESKAEPSGAQDMAGLIYSGINRLDFDINFQDGYFPAHVESNNDPLVARWLESVIYILPVAPRPEGYSPLAIKNLDVEWIRRLGQSGKDCYAAIVARNLQGLGESMNECMRCWEAILPHTVKHPAIKVDLPGLLNYYQNKYAGAMYSGCGGGYLFIATDEPVPGASGIKVRIMKGSS
jgi:hypothetical protein